MISSLSSFSVFCYEMLWSLLSWHGPAVKKAPSDHSPFVLLTACEAGKLMCVAQPWLRAVSRKHWEMVSLLFWILQSYLLLSAVLQFLATHHKCMVSLCCDSKTVSINISLNALSAFPLS